MFDHHLCQDNATIRQQIEIVKESTTIDGISGKFDPAIIFDRTNDRKVLFDPPYLLIDEFHN